jgi:mannose-6-phosphate isomerase-like protein (cupin superfamily)
MNEIFIVQSGTVVLYWESEFSEGKVERIEMSPGSVLTVEVNEWHELRNEAKENASILYFGVLAIAQ